MAVCSPSDIIAAAQCKNNLNPFFAEVYKTALYCRWKSHLESGTPLTCDIQELFDESACLMNFQVSILKVIQTQLLCDIKNLI